MVIQIMQRDLGEKDEGNAQSKRRRTQSKYNKQSPRYECFCAKQYLSYPALYLHLKNKHNSYFISTKGGKKVESTKLVQSFDSTEGYKVYKIPLDSANMQESEKKDVVTPMKQFDASFPQENQIFFPPTSYLSYPPYQPFHFEFMPHNNRDEGLTSKTVSIQIAFSKFVESLARVSIKQRTESELLLMLLVQCLNRHYQMLRDERTGGKDVRRYTAEFNCEYIGRIFSYFQEVYLPELRKQEGKPYSFFLKHAYIITSQGYKRVLRELQDFLNNRKADSQVNASGQEQLEEEQEDSQLGESPNDDQIEASSEGNQNEKES